MTDDRRKLLERVELVLDVASDDHPTPCPVGEIVRGARDGVRRELARAAGPAKVTTESYRSGWDGVFGAKATRGQA
jgi:hypothetical protein